MKIDIGAGPRNRKGFDVYTDIYLPDEVKNNPEALKKFVLTPFEDMHMFKDKEFDYAFSHHVIEHVNDPDKACSELIRIAKEGVLYFPTWEWELCFGRQGHNWMVKEDYPNHLLFLKNKKEPYFNKLHRFPKEKRRFIRSESPAFKWKDSFTWTVLE